MSTEVSLRCRCGKVRGVASDVSPSATNRLVCYCDDCQAFAHFLERPDALDAAGGTDIFQMAPARVKITDGAALLRSMRLSPKGLLRFYTECCRTPVANTMSARVPFVGLIHAFVADETDGRSRDDAFGKPIGFINGRSARAAGGEVPANVHPTAPLGVVARIARLLLGWWITGKGTPSPFFDAKSKAPRVAPRVLSEKERDALRSGRRAS